MLRSAPWSIVLVMVILAPGAAQENPDANRPPVVAEADPLSPQEQAKRFNLPEGFEIQLVAAEPDIYKPMNLNFDAAGRLWVTHSTEYPYAAGEEPKEGQPRDAVSVISGIGPDGTPQSIHTFADGLNIPIGVLPLTDSVLAHSIPNVYELRDTTGDGEADLREPLMTGFGYDDTHGMTNSFTWWVDGWVYATHGFYNTSDIEDRAGNTLRMESGNTYRFSPDGDGLQQWVHGQVNPFGLAFDPLGNLYSADCHSRPLYMLLRGAYYPSFGQPHDGLGFGPEMIDHFHGSTGIAGVAYYDAEQFPEQYQDSIYIGNVVTRKIHHDRLEQHGSTLLADTQPDLVTSDDPWFRPVDIQLGPDGALYIADFYNAIIGHYEVPLDHPDRDHHRGRIWRVVYTGTDDEPADPPAGPGDLTQHSAEQLVEDLASPNMTTRVLATHQLVHRAGSEAIQPVRAIMHEDTAATQRAHGLWVLHRLDDLDDSLIQRLGEDADRLVRVHLMRALAEREHWSQPVREVALAGVGDDDAFVRRAAADALGRNPHEDAVAPLLGLWQRTPDADTHLVHQVRIGLRDQLQDETIAAAIGQRELSADDHARLAEVAIAAPNPQTAALVLDHIQEDESLAGERLEEYLAFAANHAPADRIDVLADLMRERHAADAAFELSVLLSIRQGLARSGASPPAAVQEWAVDVADELLGQAGQAIWQNHQHPDTPGSPNPWTIGHREAEDGEPARLLSSFEHGEHLTGILRSRPLELPASFSFYMAGHNGPPDSNPEPKNLIRLRDAATDEVLAESTPPRSDVAQRYEWDLADHAGGTGYVEIVDGDTAGAWAWLAVGRFDPPWVQVPAIGPAERAERLGQVLELAAAFDLRDLSESIAARLTDSAEVLELRINAAQTLPRLGAADAVPALAEVLADLDAPRELRTIAARQLGQINNDAARAALIDHLGIASAAMATPIAAALADTRQGSEALLTAIEQGHASPLLLTDSAIVEAVGGHDLPGVAASIEALTDDLPAADERLTQTIDERREGFAQAQVDVDHGQVVFSQQCAACHSINNVGGNIGPELDGIGNRGPQRLLEDILAPNRAVDQAFRMSTIELADGRVIVGMVRRTEGEVLVVADPAGQEQTVARDDIVERTDMTRSLMPANYADIIPEQHLYDLLAFLIAEADG